MRNTFRLFPRGIVDTRDGFQEGDERLEILRARSDRLEETRGPKGKQSLGSAPFLMRGCASPVTWGSTTAAISNEGAIVTLWDSFGHTRTLPPTSGWLSRNMSPKPSSREAKVASNFAGPIQAVRDRRIRPQCRIVITTECPARRECSQRRGGLAMTARPRHKEAPTSSADCRCMADRYSKPSK